MWYHDEEWGRPVVGERALFERISLEAFQSGLAWITILRKRDAFRAAFAGFDAQAVAAFGARDVERLLGDAGIVRNRAKIEAAIANARAILAMRERGERLEQVVWSHATPAGAEPPADWTAVEARSARPSKRTAPLRRSPSDPCADPIPARRRARSRRTRPDWRDPDSNRGHHDLQSAAFAAGSPVFQGPSPEV